MKSLKESTWVVIIGAVITAAIAFYDFIQFPITAPSIWFLTCVAVAIIFLYRLPGVMTEGSGWSSPDLSYSQIKQERLLHAVMIACLMSSFAWVVFFVVISFRIPVDKNDGSQWIAPMFQGFLTLLIYLFYRYADHSTVLGGVFAIAVILIFSFLSIVVMSEWGPWLIPLWVPLIISAFTYLLVGLRRNAVKALAGLLVVLSLLFGYIFQRGIIYLDNETPDQTSVSNIQRSTSTFQFVLPPFDSSRYTPEPTSRFSFGRQDLPTATPTFDLSWWESLDEGD